MSKLPKIVAITGPTASGKTRLGVELARRFNGEIISADSRQVYRRMDLGTGKDLAEYGIGKKRIPYHLIDIIDPDHQFDLNAFLRTAYEAIKAILEADKLPIVVGGSGLYLQALIDGYNLSSAPRQEKPDLENLSLEELHERLGPAFVDRLNDSEKNNKRRLIRYLSIASFKPQSAQVDQEIRVPLHGTSKPRYETLVIGLQLPIDEIRQRIRQRLDERFNEGMLQEVQKLHDDGLSWERLESFGLEYKHIARFLKEVEKRGDDDEAFEYMKERLNYASGQFAKRQLTWFKRWEKQGREIKWLLPTDTEKAAQLLRDFLQK